MGLEIIQPLPGNAQPGQRSHRVIGHARRDRDLFREISLALDLLELVFRIADSFAGEQTGEGNIARVEIILHANFSVFKIKIHMKIGHGKGKKFWRNVHVLQQAILIKAVFSNVVDDLLVANRRPVDSLGGKGKR